MHINNYDKFIFKVQLAIEGYCDFNNISLEKQKVIDDLYLKIKKYRELKTPTYDDKSKIVNEIINVINLIGIDNFIIYDDSDIEYKVIYN